VQQLRMVTNNTQNISSDLVRISRSKKVVDVSPNIIRKMAGQGLPLYNLGKARFFSRSEFEQFIRAGVIRARGTVV
jgi:hypothetical protein